MSRPEHIAPPELFYNESEAGKYTANTRIMEVQAAMAERCIELLAMPTGEPRLILDIGCGSGLSGDALVEAGHEWVGLDISSAMLDVAVERGIGPGGAGGDVLLGDMGQGFGFRPGMFDGAISVSALQWLCYNDRKDHRSARRLESFFTSLYRSLRRGGRAALQFYPESPSQLELITACALRCGFTGGLVVDYPHSTKAKKYYLCLFAGTDPAAAAAKMPKARSTPGASADAMDEGEEDEEEGEGADDDEEGDDEDADDDEYRKKGPGGAGVPYEGRRGEAGQVAAQHRRAKRRGAGITKVKSRGWILAKKDAQRRRGKEVREDSKYTGRKRGPKF